MIDNKFLHPKLRPVPKPSSSYMALGVRSHFKGTFQKPESAPEKIDMDVLYQVHPGDLIVNITFAWEGAVAIAKKEDAGGLVSHRFPTYVFDEQIAIGKFFQYAYPSRHFKYQLELNSPGGAGRNRVLNKKGFLKIECRLPSVEEQTKIANFLTAVDEKIAQLTQKCDLLTQYKKGVMQKIFSQELRFKDDDGRKFPAWNRVVFGKIAKFSKGKGISKADIAPDGKTPCIRYGELYTEYGETIQHVKSKTNLNPLSLVLSEANDVIIPASGETQLDIATAACVMQKGIALGGDLNIIKSSANGVFLAYYLNSQKKLDIAKLSQGNSVVHLYPSQLRQLELTIPEIAEQTKIASYLTAIDDKIASAQAQLEAAKHYKQGLLQQMFI